MEHDKVYYINKINLRNEESHLVSLEQGLDQISIINQQLVGFPHFGVQSDNNCQESRRFYNSIYSPAGIFDYYNITFPLSLLQTEISPEAEMLQELLIKFKETKCVRCFLEIKKILAEQRRILIESILKTKKRITNLRKILLKRRFSFISAISRGTIKAHFIKLCSTSDDDSISLFQMRLNEYIIKYLKQIYYERVQKGIFN